MLGLQPFVDKLYSLCSDGRIISEVKKAKEMQRREKQGQHGFPIAGIVLSPLTTSLDLTSPRREDFQKKLGFQEERWLDLSGSHTSTVVRTQNFLSLTSGENSELPLTPEVAIGGEDRRKGAKLP